MARCLVVAHRTLIEDHLLDEVRSRMADGPCRFHLLVPVRHPSNGSWSEGQVRQAAEARLEDGLEVFRSLGARVTGEVGDVDPVTAIAVAERRARLDSDPFDEVVVSTLPIGPSRWLGLDVVTRTRDRISVPVTHVVAETSSV
jgi:GABA permease